MEFRRKSAIIEAIQYTDSADVYKFCGDKVKESVNREHLLVESSQGYLLVSKGDYIIKETKGNFFYPCNAFFFERVYEEVPYTYYESL